MSQNPPPSQSASRVRTDAAFARAVYVACVQRPLIARSILNLEQKFGLARRAGNFTSK